MALSITFANKETDSLELFTVDYKNVEGTVIGSVNLDKAIFSLPPKIALLHQVVTAHLASRRRGTQSTKTRAEVKGGSAKPFRQKGTGSARQGTIRAPHYVGGGVALGPKPRSYDMKTPKKMIRQALYMALSDRAAAERVIVIDEWKFAVPKTKDAVSALTNLNAEGKILAVVERDNETVIRSFSNLPHIVAIPKDQLTAYDVLASDYIIFTKSTLLGDCEITETAPKAKAAAPKKAKAVKSLPEPENIEIAVEEDSLTIVDEEN